MTFKNIRPFIALLCLMLLANTAVAQQDDQNDAVALRLYYSDLYLALSSYEIDDVPFRQKQVEVQKNDSLLTLAKRNRLATLDPYHLAAALYDANSSMFSGIDSAKFSVGALIKMPSVGDIFFAESRYEKLKVIDGNLDFANEQNQMRSGLRQPFTESQSLIGPFAVEADLLLAEVTIAPGLASVPVAIVKTQDETKIATVLDETSPTQKLALSAETVVMTPPDTPQINTSNDAESAVKLDSEQRKTSGDIDPPTNTGVVSLSGVLSDPLSSVVEWKFDADASLGAVLNELAEYVGYELTTTDDMVLESYTRQLPSLQRSISGITAEEGFLMLAGRGLETEFDHLTRSIKHTPMKESAPVQVSDSQKSAPVQISDSKESAPAQMTDSKESVTVKMSDGKESVPAQMLESEDFAALVEEFVQVSGVASMLRQFPDDVLSAAERHASRCDSSTDAQPLDVDRLHQLVVSGLQKKVPAPVVRNLVDWYQSPTGRKVLELENQLIDDDGFEQFSTDVGRAGRIIKIYNNTVTGRGIATIAVELDYAGWTLSGCKRKAENEEDAGKISEETNHGEGIKKKLTKLESVLRADMLDSLAYQFSSLSESELTEYANAIARHADLFTELQQSIAEAIELVTEVSRLSSSD